MKFLLRNARREHRELDPPKTTKMSVSLLNLKYQCLNPFTLTLNLPHLEKLNYNEVSWIPDGS